MELPLVDLLLFSGKAGADHECFLMQVLIGVGLEVEAVVHALLGGEDSTQISLKKTDPLGLSRYQEELLLARHLCVSKQVILDEGALNFMSLQCAKARVGRRTLSAGYFLLPGGAVIEAFPMCGLGAFLGGSGCVHRALRSVHFPLQVIVVLPFSRNSRNSASLQVVVVRLLFLKRRQGLVCGTARNRGEIAPFSPVPRLPKVCDDYDGNVDLAEEEEEAAGSGGKAKVQKATSDAISRQRSLLKRGRKAQAKWKPTTFYRRLAKRWLECLDNQVSDS